MTYINRNGSLQESGSDESPILNRGFTYGDALFDVLKYQAGTVAFIEDHYFRLMSSMRMLRMKIPGHFTLEGYEKELLKTLDANGLSDAARFAVGILVSRPIPIETSIAKASTLNDTCASHLMMMLFLHI